MDKNYVKEYKGHKVPEGATHCHELGQGSVSFYRVGPPIVDRYCEPLCSADDPWNACIGVPATSEELPEEPAQEWVDGFPPAGCECELAVKAPKIVIVVGKTSSGLVAYQNKSGGQDKIFVNSKDKFLPLKTQEQKDREAFIERCECSLRSGFIAGLHNVRGDSVIDVCNVLFDSGFKAPEGE
jgi:hypothetical protein